MKSAIISLTIAAAAISGAYAVNAPERTRTTHHVHRSAVPVESDEDYDPSLGLREEQTSQHRKAVEDSFILPLPDVTVPQTNDEVQPEVTVPQTNDEVQPEVTVPQTNDEVQPEVTVPQTNDEVQPEVTVPQTNDEVQPEEVQVQETATPSYFPTSSRPTYLPTAEKIEAAPAAATLNGAANDITVSATSLFLLSAAGIWATMN